MGNSEELRLTCDLTRKDGIQVVGGLLIVRLGVQGLRCSPFREENPFQHFAGNGIIQRLVYSQKADLQKSCFKRRIAEK